MRFGFPFLGFPNKPNTFYNKKYEEAMKSLHTYESIPSSDNDNKKNCDDSDTYFFDVFGVRLYYDDILLISLIFLLYNEGIEDTSLFIALILLLLS